MDTPQQSPGPSPTPSAATADPAAAAFDETTFAAWVGRTEVVEDDLSPSQAASVAAMLDRDGLPLRSGDPLPMLWHWFHFLPRAPQARLDVDGHPQRGGFLPPIPLPRRMFAGSRVTRHQPLRIGMPATRTGEVTGIRRKVGSSGTLAFVTVRYVIVQGAVTCIEEVQDIVYREPGRPVPAPVPAPWPALPAGATVRELVPDTRLLFRFSALTFNAHRIHYDRPYAMQEEGYPGLVVHGPLTAVLLADLVEHQLGQPLGAFRFRGVRPLFDGWPVRLVSAPGEGGSVALTAYAADGAVAIEATGVVGQQGPATDHSVVVGPIVPRTSASRSAP
jgi:3-methylfumaryl-CoA hydratase